MKTQELSIKYASLKAVKRFFGIKSNAIQFPTDFDVKNADEQTFLKAVRKVQNAEPNSRGERIVKPTFSFGRVLVKMSKNAPDFALAQCCIYLTDYDYDLGDGKTEKRAQIVIAPPVEDEDDEEIIDLSFLGEKPQSASDDDDDDDDDDEPKKRR